MKFTGSTEEFIYLDTIDHTSCEVLKQKVKSFITPREMQQSDLRGKRRKTERIRTHPKIGEKISNNQNLCVC